MVALLSSLKVIAIGFVIIFTVIIIYFLIRHYQLTKCKKGEVSLLPTTIPYLGVVLELGQRPIEFLIECSKKTTEIFGILIAGQRFFIITCPHSTLAVIQSSKDLSIFESHKPVMLNLFNISEDITTCKDCDYDLLRKWFSTYLLNDKSLDLLCKRMMVKFSDIYRLLVTNRLKQPENHEKNPEKLQDNQGNQENQEEATVLPLYDFISRFIFHIAVGAIYNHSINNSPEKCDLLYDAFKQLDKVTAICVAGLPIKYLPDAFKSLKYIQDITNPLNHDLSELLQRRCEYFDELSLNNPAFKDNNGVLNSPIFWASVSNSMPATFWLLFYVLQNENLINQLRNEIMNIIPNYERFYDSSFLLDDSKVKEEIITIEQLNNLILIDACLTETLRLKSGSFIVRTVTKDNVEVQLHSGNKYKFRKGDQLALFPSIFHYDEEIYPNPNEFNPFRFVLSNDSPLEDRRNAALGKTHLTKDGLELNP